MLLVNILVNRFGRRAAQLHQTASKPIAGHLPDLGVFKRNYEKNNTRYDILFDVPKIRFTHNGSRPIEGVQLF